AAGAPVKSWHVTPSTVAAAADSLSVATASTGRAARPSANADAPRRAVSDRGIINSRDHLVSFGEKGDTGPRGNSPAAVGPTLFTPLLPERGGNAWEAADETRPEGRRAVAGGRPGGRPRPRRRRRGGERARGRRRCPARHRRRDRPRHRGGLL